MNDLFLFIAGAAFGIACWQFWSLWREMGERRLKEIERRLAQLEKGE